MWNSTQTLLIFVVKLYTFKDPIYTQMASSTLTNHKVMDFYNHILQLNKCRLNVSTSPRIRSSKPGLIEEHMHHQHPIKTKKPSLVFLGDSIAYRFKRYENIWDNHFKKQTVNCRIKGDRTKNLFHKIEDLVIPQQRL